MVSSAWRAVTPLLLANILIPSALAWNNDTTPLSFFYSRPDLQPPAMTVKISRPELLDNGYVFVTPYQQPQAGPFIFDKQGNLVFSGFGEVGPHVTHNLHVCKIYGSDHLCMFQGNQMFGYARGHAVIMNSDYKIVKTIESVGDVPAMDQHEFKLTPNGETALVTIYQNLPYDLSRVNITDRTGWIMNSIFQEINVTDNSLIFEWNSLNHVEPWDTYVYPMKSDISGSGKIPQSPWDYFHINSVDKSTVTGNYLISARHMGKLYNIDGRTGDILWTLEAGGLSDFVCTDFEFAFQHDARIHGENETHMLISLYDNASNNANKTAKRSAGKFISLDLTARTASLYKPLMLHPENMLSASQGNTQLLPNGNVFQGYGSWPRMTEHTEDGTCVWSAQLGPGQGINMVYRSFSFPWKSIPAHTKPALWTYSRREDGMMAFYVSWNGCTEIATWNFYGGNNVNDLFTYIGSTIKNGFETRYSSDIHYEYTFVEAVALDGTSLRNSSLQKTFVPGPQMAADGCPWLPAPAARHLLIVQGSALQHLQESHPS